MLLVKGAVLDLAPSYCSFLKEPLHPSDEFGQLSPPKFLSTLNLLAVWGKELEKEEALTLCKSGHRQTILCLAIDKPSVSYQPCFSHRFKILLVIAYYL